MKTETEFNDYLKDAGLGITTTGRDDRHSGTSKFPYEPTSYSVLDRLAGSGYIDDTDRLIDYGCGKGRVPIYMNHRTGCRTVGVEIEQDFYEIACGNLAAYLAAYPKEPDEICIIHSKAQAYEVPEDATACFFFNPFSSDILKNVIPRILESVQESPRPVKLFFFYPSQAYVGYLSTVDRIMFEDEIDCTDLFPEDDDRNRILIYEIQ